MRNEQLLGAHMSVAGGLHKAVERAASAGCTALQIFVKNSNQWKGKPLGAEEVATYKAAVSESSIRFVAVHDSYLINLCATNPETLQKSREALREELERCRDLGIRFLNIHPGAHMGDGEAAGIERIAASLNIVHEKTHGADVLTVLETTAGQGTTVGYTFEHLRDIIAAVESPARMAVCIDTCHIYAAGYDIATDEGYHRTMEQFGRTIGFDRLVMFHVNDSRKPLGSRVDRHEHIGKGTIGTTGFRLLMNDERFVRIPKILETPKGDDLAEDRGNLKTLRQLVRRPEPGRQRPHPATARKASTP